jgi:serine/threonine protein kinase HipA of HipAB toxin-antitoxin module
VFAGYSFEQYYQGVRRCWRFGQRNPVVVDHVASDGETEVLANRQRKAAQSDKMFAALVEHMRDGMHIDRTGYGSKKEEVPSWL